jgi:predicted Zn-dependent protease with MMP-like domain
VERYVHELGQHLLGFKPGVEFSEASTGAKRSQAGWSAMTVTFYLRNTGKKWPSRVTQEHLDALVLHEFTHHWVDNHFSDDFIYHLARLGAKLRSCKAVLR